MWYFQPSFGFFLLSPVYWPLTHPWARALTLHPTPGSAPLTRASSSARLGGLETLDNKQLQPSHWPPHACTGIYPPQTNTLLSFQTGFFPPFSSPSHSLVAQNSFSFFFYSSLLFLPEERRKKNEGSDGSHFSSTFLFSLTSRFLALPLLPGHQTVCVCVCVCVSVSVCVGECVFLPHGWASAWVWERWMPESLSLS